MSKKKIKVSKIEIIAEIANAHQGKSDLAIEIAKSAIRSGADAVKFQIYFADELLTYKHQRFMHFKKQSFEEKDWKKIFNSIKPLKKKIYCDIFGEKALKLAEKYDLDGYKIHSSDISNVKLLYKLSKLNKRKKIFLSAGGSTLRELAKAISILRNKNKLILLYGFQNYPTKINDLNLNNIKYLKKYFGNYCDIGYMDHTDADDKMNFFLPILSVKLGAKIIEKHITYNRQKKGIDYHSSLNPNEFNEFTRIIKSKNILDKKLFEKLKICLGKKSYFLTEKELEYRSEVKKVWVAKKDLKPNHVIKINDVIMKRSEEKDESLFIDRIVGTKIIKRINKDEIIKTSYLKNKVLALIIARTKSSRLHKKILKKFQGLTSLEHIILRLKRSKKIDEIILCTTRDKSDDIICKIAKKYKVSSIRGSEKDVLSRMLLACNHRNNIAIRVTGDDLLIDPIHIDKAITYFKNNNLEYCSIKSIPKGTECELFSDSMLFDINKSLKDKNSTEYLTNIINENYQNFIMGDLSVNKKYRKNIRLTLDTKEDYQVINYFLKAMDNKKKLFNYSMNDLISYFKKQKKVLRINKNIKQKKIPNYFSTNILWNKLIT